MRQVILADRLYQVDDNDLIIKRRGEGYIKSFPDKDGYLKYAIGHTKGTYNIFVHKFVLELYNDPAPEDLVIDHIDDVRTNNHISNLQLLTVQQNAEKGNAHNWFVVSPTGKEFEVYNLAKFCREYNLHRSHMADVAARKIQHYKGWKCYDHE